MLSVESKRRGVWRCLHSLCLSGHAISETVIQEYRNLPVTCAGCACVRCAGGGGTWLLGIPGPNGGFQAIRLPFDGGLDDDLSYER